MDDRIVRCLVVSDFNSGNFCGLLNNDKSTPIVCAAAGPYGQVAELLLDLGHPCWRDKPEALVVWTSPETAVPSFHSLLDFQAIPIEQILEEVDRYTSSLLGLSGRVPTVFVPTWVLPPQQRGLGVLELKHGAGAAGALLQMNARLALALRETAGYFVLDAQRWVTSVGPRACNPQLWYMGKVPFSASVFKEAVADIKAALTGLHGQSRKLLLVDLDDTLWGGSVGEVGWPQLSLGGHDPIGEAFVDFQLAIRSLKHRGVILGIISKNEETVALEAIRNHPEMVLRLEDFAGWRINWDDKARNITDLVDELNLGLQSVVYIDNDAGQRQRIRGALPEVFVPEWPADKMLYRESLWQLRCFDSPVLSLEDLARADMYAVDRQRKDSAGAFQTIDEWIRDLRIAVQIEVLDESNLPRATQLFNKTNQMNLSTRRLAAAELWQWSQREQCRLWTFRVRDRFGDCGLAGIASLEWENGRGKVVDFILSCRAFGRRIEETMLHTLLHYARCEKLSRVEAVYLATKKNKPCLDFFQGSGFMQFPENTYAWDVREDYPAPADILLC
jgi:FkbH-like protein